MSKALVLASVLFVGVTSSKAQQTNNYDFSGIPANPVPLPIGPDKASSGGFYGAIEVAFMSQTRPLGNQVVAVYGFRDSIGAFSGTPGTFVGSGAIALTTGQLGRSTYQPGYEITLGYKFESGFAISLSYMDLVDAKYTAGASGPGNISNPGNLNQNTYLYSGVYNFTNYYSGPKIRTFDDQFSQEFSPFPITGRLYGIWNGATYETISFIQHFSNLDITGRAPVMETDYSRTYALMGFRYSQISERFNWFTVATDVNGNSDGTDAANYNNTLKQRMFGAFLGCGNEVYLGNNFALSLDATAALMLDFARASADYEREDRASGTQSKNKFDQYSVVPNVGLKPSFWWYPIKGVSVRASYNALMYFNTYQMTDPIGWNFGDIEPGYTHKAFRMTQGIEIGVGISF
jgi:hypothetical protein